MERPEDEIVRRVRPDLARRRVEVRLDWILTRQNLLSEVVLHAHWPRRVCQFGIDEIGGPSAPEDRSSAEAERAPWEVLVEGHWAVGVPWLTPYRARVALARRAQVRRQVLHVLRQGERTSLEHEDAVAVRRIDVEEVRRCYRTEAAAANHEEIERPRVGVHGPILAGQRLLDRVADVTANVVETERGGDSDRCRHRISLPCAERQPCEMLRMSVP